MEPWQLMALVASLGAVGGLVNCAISGEFVLPKLKDGVWRPGWVGNVLVGAVAAFVVTGTNGQLAGVELPPPEGTTLSASWAQIAGAIVIGLGGGNILTNMAARRADQISKDNLASALRKAVE